MIYMIAQYVHKAIEAATPWLVGTVAGLFVLWLIMLCYKAKPFAKELKWFFGLMPLHKFVVIYTVSFFTLWCTDGGSAIASAFVANIKSGKDIITSCSIDKD